MRISLRSCSRWHASDAICLALTQRPRRELQEKAIGGGICGDVFSYTNVLLVELVESSSSRICHMSFLELVEDVDELLLELLSEEL